MTHFFKKVLLFCILLASSISTFAQVTIGSNRAPSIGSLLDLKEEESISGAPNASKGLAMPRVNLLSLTITDPLKGLESTIEGASTTPIWDRNKHIGLLVYHTDDCTLNGSGLYIWGGDSWSKLGASSELSGLRLSTNNLLFYNGLNTIKNVTVDWKSIASNYSPPTYSGTGMDFTFSPLSGLLPTTSPQTLSISVADIPQSELDNNIFSYKTGTITFSFADSPCNPGGGPETRNITITQLNKALTVNDKVNPGQVEITTAGTNTATIKSNSQWELSSLYPVTYGGVTSSDLNVVKGSNLDDGSTETDGITYNMAIGPGIYRSSYLTFSDIHTEHQFNDVKMTVTQCIEKTDLTMRQHVDIWEELFGTIPGVDEPNSDGDINKNKRRVQWHYTRPDLPPDNWQQSIYFSALFGTERWMITNLATKTYPPRTATPEDEWLGAPLLTNNYTPDYTYTQTYWGYPNQNDVTDSNLSTEYDAHQRLGLLYNWPAATAKENTSIVDQRQVAHARFQGICPAGWHLPAGLEWQALFMHIADNPTLYSTNTQTGNNHTSLTVRDMCEEYASDMRGQSLSLFEGGFNVMLTGVVSGGSVAKHEEVCYFWCSSAYMQEGGSIYIFNHDEAKHRTGGAQRAMYLSVRCKQD